MEITYTHEEETSNTTLSFISWLLGNGLSTDKMVTHTTRKNRLKIQQF